MPEAAAAVPVLQAEMLSCGGIDYFSCLIIHLLILFKWPDLKVYSCLTAVELRFTTLTEKGLLSCTCCLLGVNVEWGMAALKCKLPVANRVCGTGFSLPKY